jgi:hypothetical protein
MIREPLAIQAFLAELRAARGGNEVLDRAINTLKDTPVRKISRSGRMVLWSKWWLNCKPRCWAVMRRPQ